MPSQEDDLNELLNELLQELPQEEEVNEPLVPEDVEGGTQQQMGAGYWEDVTEEDSEDGDIQEIQDLLNKFDRNEKIEDQTADLDSSDEAKSPADRLRTDIEEGELQTADAAVDSKKRKALEKKRLKEEKAAIKKAAKEAARVQKEEKRRQKKNKGRAPEPEAASPEKNDDKKFAEYDMVADKDLLDSIVSEAGRLNREETFRQEDNAVKTDGENDQAVDTSDDISPKPQEGNSETSDIIALDMDEIDAYIPDISQDVEEEEGKKKKGMMSKFVDFLMEEEEEPENEDVKMSEENQEILDELDKEKGEKAKKPKKKKDKKKNDKKKKKEQKPKKAKPPKPKKAKKPKEEEPYFPGKKLTFKKVLPVLLLGATVGAVLYIFVNLSVDYAGKQEAADAYAAGDYQTCYLKLYGKKLNETEEMMLGKSQSILYIKLWYQEYLKIAEEGSDVEILDNLIQVVNDYPALQEYALQWNALPEVYEVYSQMVNILYERFGITEAQAQEIAAIKSDIAYTKAVTALAEGRGYGTGSTAGQEEPGKEMPVDDTPNEEPSDEEVSGGESDILPEESELGQDNFVDNESGQL